MFTEQSRANIRFAGSRKKGQQRRQRQYPIRVYICFGRAHVHKQAARKQRNNVNINKCIFRYSLKRIKA